MAVLMNINGNSVGDGFLIAPLFTTYDADISLSTDVGSESVTLQASPDVASLVFSQTALTLTTTPTIVQVHATLPSDSREDTTIEVRQGTDVLASFTITSIKHPIANFRGRFEARFATDGLAYNRNPMYTATIDTIPGGWTWGLEGEPNFVPTTNNVPENLEDTGMGRVVRLNSPISLRSHAAPIISTVDSISGELSTGTTETFLAGDSLIGQPVNFGPDTYFAGNQPPITGDPRPEEIHGAQVEPLALFELHFGTMVSGKSQVGPFNPLVVPSTVPGFKTRDPDSRPIPIGVVGAASERAEFGLPSFQAFSETRIDLLVADYNALAPGPSLQRRNLARRIGHLLSSVSTAKRSAVLSANPGEFTIRTGSIPQAWDKEVYGGLNEFSGSTNDGRIDENLQFNPGGSSMVNFMSQFIAFNVEWQPFAFHSDELCGHHKGFVTHLNFDGSYAGDPHTRTLDGTRYDFQAVGEFTLLRGGGIEIQVRQTPVATQNPINDSYSGLKSCVSLITAVAATVGSHCISLQPDKDRSRLQFYLDGRPVDLPIDGIDLNGNRVSGFDANGTIGLRVDYENGTLLMATPRFWNAHKVHYINIDISNTKADEGIMGFITKDSWLPRLRNGQTVGSKPSSLHDRYIDLYRTFADSWRVSDNSSLFVYAASTSTSTFTDKDWPAEDSPCKLKPEFEIPGVPVHQGMPLAEAQLICQAVTDSDLHDFCIFDVATTGDKDFAEGYLFMQELRKCGTAVIIEGHQPPSLPGREQPDSIDIEIKPPPKTSIVVNATVKPISKDGSIPAGRVTFLVDGEASGSSIELDKRGKARKTIKGLSVGEHKIRAKFQPKEQSKCHSSSSRNLIYTVEKSDGPAIKPGSRPWYFWLIILLIILLLLLFIFKVLI